MRRWVEIARFIGIGWYIAACIILGIGVGYWLDSRWGTTPWITLIGVGVGLLAAFWGVYRMATSLMKGDEVKK